MFYNQSCSKIEKTDGIKRNAALKALRTVQNQAAPLKTFSSSLLSRCSTSCFLVSIASTLNPAVQIVLFLWSKIMARELIEVQTWKSRPEALFESTLLSLFTMRKFKTYSQYVNFDFRPSMRCRRAIVRASITYHCRMFATAFPNCHRQLGRLARYL
jgi:hypothetical protein